MRLIRPCPLPGLLFAVLFAFLGLRPAAADVTVTDIGTINGRASAGIGINHAGDVAGVSYFSGTIGVPNGPPAEPFLTHGVLFQAGVLHDLGAIEGNPTCPALGCQSEAFDVNDQDWVVGWTDNGSSGTLAFLWLPAATTGGVAGFNVLPALSPVAGSAAVALNRQGQMVGFSKLANFTTRAALWQLTPGGPTLTDLGTLRADQGGGAIADDINDLGQIVGSAADESFLPQGFLWLPAPAYGLPAGLNNLTASLGPGNVAEAVSIDDQGEVAGVVDGFQPFVWLPVAAHGLPAGTSTLALDRNLLAFIPSAIGDGGVVIGQAYVETNPHTHDYVIVPAAWHDGEWTYLNDLLPNKSPWSLASAQGISHTGRTTRITGVGLLSGVTDVNGLTPAIHGYVLNVDCPGDLDGDGRIDAGDVVILQGELGQSVPPGTDGDLDGNGVVDRRDLTLLTAQLGQACLSGSSELTAAAVGATPGPAVRTATDDAASSSATAPVAPPPGFDLASYLRPYDLATANAVGARAASTAQAAPPAAAAGPAASGARGLTAWPLPYRGDALHIALSPALGSGARADVAIFDLAGRRVRTLAAAGRGPDASALQWDGRDANGAAVRNGVYFLRARGAGIDARMTIPVIR